LGEKLTNLNGEEEEKSMLQNITQDLRLDRNTVINNGVLYKAGNFLICSAIY
jgi:hypothetical protein